jgi:AAA+ superfamily predicted ATPase
MIKDTSRDPKARTPARSHKAPKAPASSGRGAPEHGAAKPTEAAGARPEHSAAKPSEAAEAHPEPRHAPEPRVAASVARTVERVRLLMQRRLLWLEHLAATRRAAGQSPESALDGSDSIEAERRWLTSESSPARALGEELARVEEAQRKDRASGLARVVAVFDLSEAESDVLQVCLACAVEPGLRQVCGFLHRNPADTHVSEALVARLGGHLPPLIGPGRPLLRWRLVRTREAGASDQLAPALVDRHAPLFIDPYILEYVSGEAAEDPALLGVTAPVGGPNEQEGVAPIADWPIAEVVARIKRVWMAEGSVRVLVLGPPGSGRRTFAAAVAAALGQRLVAVDAAAVPEARWAEASLHAQRRGLLLGNTLAWCEVQAGKREPPPPGTGLQFITADVDLELPPLPDVVDERVELPRLTVAERRDLWRRLVPAAATWKEPELDHLAERYRVQVGDIATIGRRNVRDIGEAREECRKATRYRLGELAQLLGCPFSRDDLMLPASLRDVLGHFLFEAKERVRFWETPSAARLFPRGRALVALMTGPPGTGKTMAAQVIAAELGLDLFRVDLASSLSKYIGETAKNLGRIFARAAEMNAVLLFDEADALFSKRTEVQDAHDRYANTDTNYLLQLIEDFDGIALLASNRKHNIDSAFIRRIRYVMDFQNPEAGERLQIWQRLTRELVGPGREAELAPILRRIADQVELTGAQIKLALLGAVFGARQAGQPLQLAHLYLGIERELGKAGRDLGPKARERIERYE